MIGPDTVGREEDAKDGQCGEQIFGRRRPEECAMEGRRVTAKRAFHFASGWDEERKGISIVNTKTGAKDGDDLVNRFGPR
jgi:predicted NAD-dependent protein-ADP-ribosyltransferase YbiA (DUF1768 family)